MDTEKKKILLIDDNEDIHDLVDRTLKGTEFDFLKASNGREGIQIAKEQKPDLILLDIMMPGFDGYMSCKVLKRNTVTKDIPVIFLTAKKAKENIQAALKAGASDYIVKPFSPSDLLTHLRGIGESSEISRAKKNKESQKMEEEKELSKEKSLTKYQKKSLINIKRYGDKMVLSTEICGIVLENCKIFRDIFANFVSDEIFKVVIDFSKIEHIDSAGLGLLISVKESLRNYGGDLRITSPSKEVNNRFSFIRLTDLFHPFNNLQEAIESFQEQDSKPEQIEKLDELSICMSCTFVNTSKARYCSFCGTNLVLGKGDAVLKILTQSISHRIFSETNTTDINEINKARDIKADDYKIPSKFLVEINDPDLIISYQSNKTDSKNLKNTNQITIEAPVMGKEFLPLAIGTPLSLANPQIGVSSKYETQIDDIDVKNFKLKVRYDTDAISLHSKKNFSVAPKTPIPISFIVPTLKDAGEIFTAKILEISRVRMVIFSEDTIPLDQCLAVSFELGDYHAISSPLVIAQKGRQRYMYNIEFKVIDGKESSKITQYMYKRQIELANVKEI